MYLGVHVNVATGYVKAAEYARTLGCTAVQFFSGNPKTYRVSSMNTEALTKFASLRQGGGIARAAIHTSYLINLASDDPKIAGGSLRLLENDLDVAAAGSIDFVNTHLGSYGKRDREEAFVAVCRALETALARIRPGVMLVLENSAGAGNLCGGTLEELGRFVRALAHPQLGICIDTAHAWAAGYAINSTAGVDRFLADADAHIGLAQIPMFHLNDTQIPLGGNRDRHWHIGDGQIGIAGFRALAAHGELAEKTGILETPGEEADDERNMRTIRMIFEGVAA